MSEHARSSREERYHRRERARVEREKKKELSDDSELKDFPGISVVLGLPARGDLQSSESSAEETTMPPVTRLKYKKFFGDGEQDVDDWYEDFMATAKANQEDSDSTKRVFGGLMKDHARKWLKDQPAAIQADFDDLSQKFLTAFRESGGEARAISKLNRIRMEPSKSVLKYRQRLKDLIRKLATEPAENMKIAWYVDGFPENMSFQVRREKPGTLTAAMEAAQDYESSAKSLRRVIKKEDRRLKKSNPKGSRKKKSRKVETSESTSTSSSPGYSNS